MVKDAVSDPMVRIQTAIERIILRAIHDVARVDRPSILELGDEIGDQFVAMARIAGRKRQDRASVVRVNETVQA